MRYLNGWHPLNRLVRSCENENVVIPSSADLGATKTASTKPKNVINYVSNVRDSIKYILAVLLCQGYVSKRALGKESTLSWDVM